MATKAETITPTPLTPGALLLAVLIVGAFASLAASLITGIVIGVEAVNYSSIPVGAGEAVGAILFAAGMATLISILVVLAALLVIALPLTLMLVNLGASPTTRNMVLLAVAAVLAALLGNWSVMTFESWDMIFPTYAIVSAILWTLWLGRIERRAIAD